MNNIWLKNIRIETNYTKSNGLINGMTTKLVDIHISDGLITEVRTHKGEVGRNNEINGKGCLLLPGLREMHCHFDKGKLGLPWEPIKPARTIKDRFTQELIDLNKINDSFNQRMERLIKLELSNGVSFFRSHVDVHPKIGQKFLNQVQEVLENYKNQFEFELVAFPQHGLLLSNAYEEMKLALKNGANLVGGVDPYSLDGNLEKSLDQTFDLATQFNVPIDIHLHERSDRAKLTYKKLIELTLEAQWQGRVTISHGYGLRDFSVSESKELFAELAENEISLISSVPLNYVIPPIESIRKAGVKIALGCDNINDSWSPFGDGNILEKLNRYVEIFNLTSQQDLTESLELVSGQSIMGEDNFLKIGSPATFILTNSDCTAEFIARKKAVEMSMYRGNIIFNNI